MIKNMQKNLIFSFVLALPVNAVAINCPSGEAYSVTGSITTRNNLDGITQTGNVSITLTLQGGDNTSTNYQGSIEGLITSQVGVNSYLTHDIDFYENSLVDLTTFNDHAIIKLPALRNDVWGQPCEYKVTEAISDWEGYSEFDGSTGYMVVQGTLRNCDLNYDGDTDDTVTINDEEIIENHNSFSIIAGEICK